MKSEDTYSSLSKAKIIKPVYSLYGLVVCLNLFQITCLGDKIFRRPNDQFFGTLNKKYTVTNVLTFCLLASSVKLQYLCNQKITLEIIYY